MFDSSIKAQDWNHGKLEFGHVVFISAFGVSSTNAASSAGTMNAAPSPKSTPFQSQMRPMTRLFSPKRDAVQSRQQRLLACRVCTKHRQWSNRRPVVLSNFAYPYAPPNYMGINVLFFYRSATSWNEGSLTDPPASPRPATGRLYDQPAN
jgi:hypothetical protein